MNNNCNNNNLLQINPLNFIYQDPRCNSICNCKGKCKCDKNKSIDSNHVLYVGANIAELGINFGDTLTSVISKLSSNSGTSSDIIFTDDYFDI